MKSWQRSSASLNFALPPAAAEGSASFLFTFWSWDCLILVDTKRLGYDANEECVLMPSTKTAYSPEFKAEAVKLYRSSGHSLKSIASDPGVSTNSLHGSVNLF